MKEFEDFFTKIEKENKLDLPIFKEFAYDFKNKEFLLKNGRHYLISENEALKIWIYKALKTKRYIYEAYTNRYGSEILNAIGLSLDKDIEKAEIKRYIKEALLASPYIKEVDNFIFKSNKDKLDIEFDVLSIYGKFSYLSEDIYEY